MTTEAPQPGILLVDDGELDEVAQVLDREGLAYRRLRGGQIPDQLAPPRDLLIVTPRRAERVRRGSPADALPGRPLRIIAVSEDSPAMRRRLRRNGLHLLIRLPASSEVWRLLVARALYRGSERRGEPRVAVGSPVEVGNAQANGQAVLLDLSNRGCRLRTDTPRAIGDAVRFAIPADTPGSLGSEPLELSGRVRRCAPLGDQDAFALAVLFDANLDENRRTRLTTLINHWASGPCSAEAPRLAGAPAIPPCQLPSIPDLTLDDETDPPIAAAMEGDLRVELGGAFASGAATPTPTPGEDSRERRAQPRGHYASPLVAASSDGPFVLIGRDLSVGGMRIERHPDLHVGDRFEINLHGPDPSQPIHVHAEIVRDDGEDGFGVAFQDMDRKHSATLEKLVACLPDVESLEDGEASGLGAVLSEIMGLRERPASL